MYAGINLCSNHMYLQQRRTVFQRDIKVGGEGARQSDDTFCASFVERGTGSVTNSMTQGCGCSAIDICCEACSCQYNDHQTCTASQIDIEGSNACECTQTKCRSFCCKN